MTTPHTPGEKVIPAENVHEAYYLFSTAGLGVLFNFIIIVTIILRKKLRKMTSAFLIHQCILDIIKCGFCIPFAQSLLSDAAPRFCDILGGSYVIIISASTFNLLAMVCCEAYTFGEHNTGGDNTGSLCCVVFGLFIIYIGSLIVHLGPTIIGGDFSYNDMIGNCIFVYGTIKSYVVHAMFIVITTLTMVAAFYYIKLFYRHVQTNSTHRVASLVRASVALSRGQRQRGDINYLIKDSLSRARVLVVIAILFAVCWYPLFILTLFDPRFEQSNKIYKLLTFIAWSNAAINPMIFCFFDRGLNVFRKIICCHCSRCHQGDERDDPLMGGLNPNLPAQIYQRVGCRLCHEGRPHPDTQCNGGLGNGGISGLVRDRSFCELHSGGQSLC